MDNHILVTDPSANDMNIIHNTDTTELVGKSSNPRTFIVPPLRRVFAAELFDNADKETKGKWDFRHFSVRIII
jgi:hypothetical protein